VVRLGAQVRRAFEVMFGVSRPPPTPPGTRLGLGWGFGGGFGGLAGRFLRAVGLGGAAGPDHPGPPCLNKGEALCLYSLVVGDVSVPAMGAVVVLLTVLGGETMVALAAHEPRRAAGHRQATRAPEQRVTPHLGLDVEFAVAGDVEHQLVRVVRHHEAHTPAVIAGLVLEVPAGARQTALTS
jgi:hypothetical protein